MKLLDEALVGEIQGGPAKSGTIRIVLADSQAIYRVGIRKIFALEDDIQVVAQADSLEQLRASIEAHSADVVLVEGELLTGAANSIAELRRIAPDIKIIVQTEFADQNQTVALYRHGIRGIISRSISADLLMRCVRRIATGETWIDNQALHWVIAAYRAQETALLNPLPQKHLSPKEKVIITCISQGKRNKEIAFQLGTTEQVIKNCLRKIHKQKWMAQTTPRGLRQQMDVWFCLMQESSAVTVDPDQTTARPPVRARKFCAFLLTWTYIEVAYPDITRFWGYFRVGGNSSGNAKAVAYRQSELLLVVPVNAPPEIAAGVILDLSKSRSSVLLVSVLPICYHPFRNQKSNLDQ